MSNQANEVIYDDSFLKDVQRLPRNLQVKLSHLVAILKENFFDSRLHTKSLAMPLKGMFSFRINRDYRVGFKFKTSRVIQLLVADNRDNIYRRLLRKI